MPKVDSADLSHNLLGQRLGRKGRGTRERIIAATERLLADPATPLSLSAVAREASLAMTTLYLYFSDLTELLLAVLDPIMASAEESYMAHMRTRWPDESLGSHCLDFVNAFHDFWERHTRALHLRNSHTAGDARMVEHRVASARPVIDLLIFQMDGDPAAPRSLRTGMATALITGIERLVTVTTDADMTGNMPQSPKPNVPNLLQGQARVLELAIRDRRASSAAGAG